MDSSHALVEEVFSGKRPFQDLQRLAISEQRRSSPAAIRSPHEAVGFILEQYRQIEQVAYRFETAFAKKDMLMFLANLSAVCQRISEDLLHTKGQ